MYVKCGVGHIFAYLLINRNEICVCCKCIESRLSTLLQHVWKRNPVIFKIKVAKAISIPLINHSYMYLSLLPWNNFIVFFTFYIIFSIKVRKHLLNNAIFKKKRYVKKYLNFNFFFSRVSKMASGLKKCLLIVYTVFFTQVIFVIKMYTD